MTTALLTPVEDATRREFLATLTGAGLLAACGRDDGARTGAPTRPYTHGAGTTDVPVRPERVVSFGSTFTTWQLATLGIYSIGTSAAPQDDPVAYIRLVDPAVAEALDGLVSVAEGTDPDLEQIAALRPDLIVGTDADAPRYEQLSQIAPTVLLSTTTTNPRYLGVQLQLAEVTGTVPVLERLHEEYDERVAGLRDRYPGRWARLRWLVLDELGGQGDLALTNLDPTAPAHRVLADLGAPLAPSASRFANGEPFTLISRELVADLDADVVFVAPPYAALLRDQDTPISPDVLRLLRPSAAAAASDQVLPVGLTWTNPNVAALGAVLDDLERFLDDRGGFFGVAGAVADR